MLKDPKNTKYKRYPRAVTFPAKGKEQCMFVPACLPGGVCHIAQVFD